MAAISTSIVRVESAEPSAGGVTVVGSKVAVTPDGTPEIVRSTGSLKPLIEVMVIVEVSELPTWIVSEVGSAAIEKSGGGGSSVIVRLMLTSWLSAPLVPVTVNV